MRRISLSIWNMVKELMVLPPTSVHSISWSAHIKFACTARKRTSTSKANLQHCELHEQNKMSESEKHAALNSAKMRDQGAGGG